MKILSKIVLILLVIGIIISLIWLHDIRSFSAREAVRKKIDEKTTVISKLEKASVMMKDYSESDDPINTAFIRKLRSKNPNVSDKQFEMWFAQNRAKLDAGVENDTKELPLVIQKHKDEVQDMQSKIDEIGSSWLFYRN